MVPSLTELLYDLGLDNEVIGMTKFCKYPSRWKQEKCIIGGTKNVHIDRIIHLQPDLIIANKEENEKAQIEILADKFPVYLSDINSIPDALQAISEIGRLCHKPLEARHLTDQWDHFVKSKISHANKVLYLIWKDPYMAAGRNTFIHSMLEMAGFQNAIMTNRYPVLTPDEVRKLPLQYIFLSSEPYPFKEKDKIQLEKELPGVRIVLVDGEMFSWYGSRMLKAFDYFRELEYEL